MKVLMLVSNLNIGGTETYILSVSRNFLSRGIKVGVASSGKGPLARSFKKAGIVSHIVSFKQSSSLASVIKKGSYTIVHAHDAKTFAAAAALSRHRKTPVVASVHGTYHNFRALFSVAKIAKRLVSVSPVLTKWLAKHRIAAEKTLMIPNGIDTSAYRPSDKHKWRKGLGFPRTAQVLAYAGRLSRDKYPIARKAVLAAERIARSDRRFIAVLIGPGSKRPKLIRLADNVNRRLGRRAIVVLPSKASIRHVYHAADVVVGTGRVALEAMACGKPVVAAGTAGFCGLVTPENIKQMIQCHFGDHGAFEPLTASKLSAAIKLITGNAKRARRLGRFGVQTVKRKASIQKVGARLLRMYRGLSDKAATAGADFAG